MKCLIMTAYSCYACLLRWWRTSQVTYVSIVPRVGNETLCPLGVAMGNTVCVTRVWSIHIKTPPIGRRQPMHLYIYFCYVLWLWSGELLIPRSERELRLLRREQHAHRWPSMVRGAMLARPTRRAAYHRPLGGRETQMLRRERHAHRWPSRWGEQC